jgi:hypothetical protein
LDPSTDHENESQPGRARAQTDEGGGRALVAGYFEMWNTGDVSIAGGILAADWLDHTHPEIRGPESVARAVEQIRASRPDLRFTVEAVLDAGDLVAAVGVASGSRLIWLFRHANGSLAEMWTYRGMSA